MPFSETPKMLLRIYTKAEMNCPSFWDNRTREDFLSDIQDACSEYWIEREITENRSYAGESPYGFDGADYYLPTFKKWKVSSNGKDYEEVKT